MWVEAGPGTFLIHDAIGGAVSNLRFGLVKVCSRAGPYSFGAERSYVPWRAFLEPQRHFRHRDQPETGNEHLSAQRNRKIILLYRVHSYIENVNPPPL